MKSPTEVAKKLMIALRYFGVKFTPEYWDGHKHVDIRIPSSKIDIEVDGEQHSTNYKQILSDLSRSKYSRQDNYDTIHITNQEINKDLGKIASAVAKASDVREEQIQKQNTSGNQGALN
jgi:very-short-patch-repair endonuclease